MSHREDNSAESDNGPSTPKKIKKHYKQKFRDEWLSDTNFKTWLRRDPNDLYRAICVVCDAKISADRVVLRRHAEGIKHIKKIKPSTSLSQPSVSTIFEKKSLKSDEEKRKTAEIKLAAFMAEHNISHRVMDHLIDLLPTIFPDSDIAKKIKMKRTKLQAVINNLLGISEKHELCAELKKQKFSVMIDESTDIGSVKTMCVVVRYYCEEKCQITSRFWDLIQIHGDQNIAATATAEHLFQAVIKSFEENLIPLENIIGFGSDGCNLMMGCRNSVSSRFREKCPGIIVLKCVCHSLHLCASDACKQLPVECEKLTRDIYNYFATSSKRQSQNLKEFQIFTETEVHKILKPAQTRWLSLSSEVERILEQWGPLTLFFNGRWLEDNECFEIHKQLNDPVIKTYFFFLNWMLPKFTQTNTLFQSETPMITKVHTRMNDLFKELIMTYVKKAHIMETELDKIDPTEEKYFKSLDEMYLGLGVQNQLLANEISLEKKNEIKKNCRNFLIKACVGIRKRYALNDPVLSAISKLDPENCIDDSRRDETLHVLFSLLPRLTPTSLTEQQNLDDQWRKLPKIRNDLDTTQQADVFWHKVKQFEEFSLVAEFMMNILTLPNSNAECERVFSQINDTKTKKRNKLITETIKGNMLAKQTISRHGGNCVSFQPTDKMLKCFNSEIYKKEVAIGLYDSESE